MAIERGEIVIEVDHRRVINDDKNGKVSVGNSPVFFHPLGESVRSRIIPQRSVGSGTKRVWDGIPSIPGERIHVNAKTMRARITDALDDPENKLILQQVQRADKEAWSSIRPVGGAVSGGEKERVVKLNSPEELHNWLYWMRRLVDQGQANILQGKEDLADEETLRNGGDIRLPGDPNIAQKETGGIYMKPAAKAEVAAA